MDNFEIIEENTDFIETLVSLEASLVFLHKCLVESSVPKNTEILYGILELETKCTKGKANGLSVNTLITNLRKDYKEDNLISLRDGVLEMAGVN